MDTALKSRLPKFPKLTDKDAKKLDELSDFVFEEEPEVSDLLISVGVKPILTKLPCNLPS